MTVRDPPRKRERRPGPGAAHLENSKEPTTNCIRIVHPAETSIAALGTGVGQKLSGKQRRAARRASEADRRWFEANPGRSHRIWPPFDHELLGMTRDDGSVSIIVVRQLAPGVRVRAPCWRRGGPPPPDTEEFASALFDALIDPHAQGRGAEPIAGIAERAWAYAQGGRA